MVEFSLKFLKTTNWFKYMRKIAFMLALLVSNNTAANMDELSTPTIDLVKTILEFCLEQHSASDEAINENIVLDCVYTDLAISTYKTFKTYSKMTAFVTQVKGKDV